MQRMQLLNKLEVHPIQIANVFYIQWMISRPVCSQICLHSAFNGLLFSSGEICSVCSCSTSLRSTQYKLPMSCADLAGTLLNVAFSVYLFSGRKCDKPLSAMVVRRESKNIILKVLHPLHVSPVASFAGSQFRSWKTSQTIHHMPLLLWGRHVAGKPIVAIRLITWLLVVLALRTPCQFPAAYIQQVDGSRNFCFQQCDKDWDGCLDSWLTELHCYFCSDPSGGGRHSLWLDRIKKDWALFYVGTAHLGIHRMWAVARSASGEFSYGSAAPATNSTRRVHFVRYFVQR